MRVCRADRAMLSSLHASVEAVTPQQQLLGYLHNRPHTCSSRYHVLIVSEKRASRDENSDVIDIEH